MSVSNQSKKKKEKKKANFRRTTNKVVFRTIPLTQPSSAKKARGDHCGVRPVLLIA